jgi:hypothetical protein
MGVSISLLLVWNVVGRSYVVSISATAVDLGMLPQETLGFTRHKTREIIMHDRNLLIL